MDLLTPRRTRKTLAVAGVGALATIMLSGCTARETLFLDLPEPASAEAPIIENLWTGAWIAVWGVGILTWGLMLWASVKYRRRSDADAPAQIKYNLPIEIMYTVVPLIMILGMFWFTARDQSDILTVENDQQHSVGVVGFRWAWGFNYLDEDVNTVGMPVDVNTPGAEIPTLVLPVNEKVRFELNSPDVIHSFWVPQWLFKMDVVPGRTNVFELTPDTLGSFVGRCAELCGVDHSRMLFQVEVVERAEYDAYIEDLRAKGQTGLLQTGRFNNLGQLPGEKLV